MSAELEYGVSFRVHHPSAEPIAIAEALGWRPRWRWRAGEARRDGAGRPLTGTYRESYASFALEVPAGEPLGALLRRAIGYLGQRRPLLRELTETGGRLEFWVELHAPAPTGDGLDAALLSRCGELGVGLGLLVSPFAMRHCEGERGNVLPEDGSSDELGSFA